MRLMISTLLAVGLCTACAKSDDSDESRPNPDLSLQGDDDPSAPKHLMPMRSLEELNQLVRGRMLTDATFDLLDLLVPEDDASIFEFFTGTSTRGELAAVLGMRKGLALRVATDSLTPSTMHTLAWTLALDALAGRAALVCTPDAAGGLPLNAELRGILEAACTDQAPRRDLLRALWLQLLRHDASEAELALWIEDELRESALLSGAARVRYHVRSILLGPEFLIGR